MTLIFTDQELRKQLEENRVPPSAVPRGYTALNVINALQNKLFLDFIRFFDYLEELPPITEDEEEISPRIIAKLKTYSKFITDGEEMTLFVKEKEASTFTLYSHFFYIMAQALIEKTGKNYFIDFEMIVWHTRRQGKDYSVDAGLLLESDESEVPDQPGPSCFSVHAAILVYCHIFCLPTPCVLVFCLPTLYIQGEQKGQTHLQEDEVRLLY